MKHDIVYVYSKNSSTWRGMEIKFSIRSLAKYGRNYNRIIIIGDRPVYFNEMIVHVPFEDNPMYSKERRIFEKLLAVGEKANIFDGFIMFNDDYFLMREIDFNYLPYYFNCSLELKIKKRKNNDIYNQAMLNTQRMLKDRAKDTRHFDIHYPIFFKNFLLKKLADSYDWTLKGGYVIKSLYCNTFGIEGDYRPDYKIFEETEKSKIIETIQRTDLFSTDKITRAMAELLNKLYPEKSIFEK